LVQLIIKLQNIIITILNNKKIMVTIEINYLSDKNINFYNYVILLINNINILIKHLYSIEYDIINYPNQIRSKLTQPQQIPTIQTQPQIPTTQTPTTQTPTTQIPTTQIPTTQTRQRPYNDLNTILLDVSNNSKRIVQISSYFPSFIDVIKNMNSSMLNESMKEQIKIYLSDISILQNTINNINDFYKSNRTPNPTNVNEIYLYNNKDTIQTFITNIKNLLTISLVKFNELMSTNQPTNPPINPSRTNLSPIEELNNYLLNISVENNLDNMIRITNTLPPMIDGLKLIQQSMVTKDNIEGLRKNLDDLNKLKTTIDNIKNLYNNNISASNQNEIYLLNNKTTIKPYIDIIDNFITQTMTPMKGLENNYKSS
jgi:hypothetical protein